MNLLRRLDRLEREFNQIGDDFLSWWKLAGA